MAVTTGTGFYGTPAVDAFRKATPDKYISLGDYIDEVNKPDNRDALVKSFGAQRVCLLPSGWYPKINHTSCL